MWKLNSEDTTWHGWRVAATSRHRLDDSRGHHLTLCLAEFCLHGAQCRRESRPEALKPPKALTACTAPEVTYCGTTVPCNTARAQTLSVRTCQEKIEHVCRTHRRRQRESGILGVQTPPKIFEVGIKFWLNALHLVTNAFFLFNKKFSGWYILLVQEKKGKERKRRGGKRRTKEIRGKKMGGYTSLCSTLTATHTEINAEHNSSKKKVCRHRQKE